MGEYPVFVFGSNLAGRHGRGAAKFALEMRGAIYWVGEGRQGNSYAIPVKGPEMTGKLSILTLPEISKHVNEFVYYAWLNNHELFQVTAIGCGLAGYKPEQIAPMFAGAGENCILCRQFTDVLHLKYDERNEGLSQG